MEGCAGWPSARSWRVRFKKVPIAKKGQHTAALGGDRQNHVKWTFH